MVKKALLAGINDYKKVSDLRGCINDVTNMRDILIKYFDFEASNIRVLTDTRATYQNIDKRLDWLKKGTEPGDFIVFHFAGHGSQVLDRDEQDELKEHMDELICPYDMSWDGIFITDDMLYNKFKDVKEGVHLEVFLDCCHSGTGTRELEIIEGAEEERKIIYRFLEPPADILCRSREDLKETHGFHQTSQLKRELNHILWAGCRDNQTAADAKINGTYNGAFTYYLCKNIRETAGKINRKELLKSVKDSIRHYGYTQIPQLEGPASAEDKNILEL